MLEVKELKKKYGEKPVLDGFSCSFPPGETTCLMGPSGCGKTTLLRLLLGLEEPDGGSLTGFSQSRKSAVFQENRLCETVSAVSNIRLASPGLTKEEARQMLTDLGLGDSLRQPVGTFSGGMQRRVAILRAIAAPYDLLLADEPFQGLDEKTKKMVMAYFRENTKGKTVILVTHDPKEAQALGSHLIHLGPTP